MAAALRLIRTLDEFRRLRDPWNELSRRTDVDDVWMRHEWFECWIRHFGDGQPLAVLTGWRDGQLVAAAPMHVLHETRSGVPVRVLAFLSSSISPRCNFLVEEIQDAADLFEGILRLDDWDVVETRELEDGKMATARWAAYLAAQPRLSCRIDPARMSPFLRTEPGWDAYWSSLSKSFRTHLTRGLKRLQKADSFAVSRIDQYPAFAEVFRELVETSAKSWKGGRGIDLKSRPSLQSFLLEFGQATAEAAPFETWLLRIDGEVAAFDYYLRSKQTLALLRTDFDLGLKYYSPGNNLRYHILTDLFAREQGWEYDMGGQAHPYKLEWAHRIRRHQTVTASRTVRGPAGVSSVGVE